MSSARLLQSRMLELPVKRIAPGSGGFARSASSKSAIADSQNSGSRIARSQAEPAQRVEAQTPKSLKFGLGVIARLSKGAHLTFQRRKVNDEIWLPAEAFFQGTGRVLVFKGFRFQARSEYSDYKKFSVDSSVSFSSENQ